jgi:hypothetical protein
MAPEVISKLQSLVSGESKSARKKKAKADTSTAVPATPEHASSEQGAAGSDVADKTNGESENAYIKELQKYVTSPLASFTSVEGRLHVLTASRIGTFATLTRSW